MVDPASAHPALLIDGRWEIGRGPEVIADDPATGAVVWRAAGASDDDVTRAVAAARAACEPWADRAHQERVRIVEAFAGELENARGDLIAAIATDVGKPIREADAEVSSMAAKIPISIAAHAERTGEQRRVTATGAVVVRHRPHGVLAVFGPFNFPGHLANGHIVPAVLAGNAVVFKPSEQAPLTAELMARCWQRAGLPPGVVNLVVGGPETGAALARSPGIDGVLFTGSAATGALLHRGFSDRPGKILALEMGGNNPLVVWDAGDAGAAARLVLLSAYATAGQRCTCARRLIISAGADGDVVIARVAELIDRVIVGPPGQAPEPFMGPVISNRVARRLLDAQADLIARGAGVVKTMSRVVGPWGSDRPFLSPGLLDVTAVRHRADEELFGPLLQIIRVPDLDAAITEANHTRFGLAAGLLCGDPASWREFQRRVHAGVLVWNRPTTGAPSDAPFGGVGASGNHRPSAYYAADSCAYPVTAVEVSTPAPSGSAIHGLRVA